MTPRDGPVPEWHDEVISPATGATLDQLRDSSLLDGFYLAGGTGLALRLGHRLSEDLDFFHRERFETDQLLQRLQMIPGTAVLSTAPHTVHASIGGTKVSFLGYSYPVLFPMARRAGVEVADPLEIGCMKVSAISSRGTKRDFVDLYAVLQRAPLAEVLRLFQRKYAGTGYNLLHVHKSLMFFRDAEKDPMPQMRTAWTWEQVKRYFLGEVPRAG
jgi:hypothetical protein